MAVFKAMGLGCLMVILLIVSTSHAGEADEEDDTAVSLNQINIYLTILKDCNPRSEMEKRAWNRGFYLGIGKRLWPNLNIPGIVSMCLRWFGI